MINGREVNAMTVKMVRNMNCHNSGNSDINNSGNDSQNKITHADGQV